MLINDNAASASEHFGMHLRAAHGTIFIGSPTAGQNGNVTNFGLAGGITVQFTGLGVTWPNGAQLQRVGLQPDISVRPTKAALVAGRDEVLETALAFLEQVPAKARTK